MCVCIVLCVGVGVSVGLQDNKLSGGVGHGRRTGVKRERKGWETLITVGEKQGESEK